MGERRLGCICDWFERGWECRSEKIEAEVVRVDSKGCFRRNFGRLRSWRGAGIRRRNWRERERELSGGEFGRESGGCCRNSGGICKATESQSRQRNFERLREEGGEVDGVRKFRFPTENGRNASFREIRISGLICGWQHGGRARNSWKKAWGERGGVRALIRGCRSTVGCGQGKLKIGERRLRGVDGREDERSEGSRTVDELLERESVVAAEMRSQKLGKMKTGNWEDSREDGRDGRFPWWRMEERDREEGEGRDEAFSVEEGGGMFSLVENGGGRSGKKGKVVEKVEVMVVAVLDSCGGGARSAEAAGTTAVVSAWPGQGVAAVVAAAAAAATAVGLFPWPSVSSHSRWRRLLSFFSNDG